MKKTLIAILVAGLMAPALSFAEKGDFVIRARVTHVAPDESSNLYSNLRKCFRLYHSDVGAILHVSNECWNHPYYGIYLCSPFRRMVWKRISDPSSTFGRLACDCRYVHHHF